MARRVAKNSFFTALFATLLASQGAQAGFVLTLDDLGDDAGAVVITDLSGSDLNGAAGAITYSGGIGSFVVNVTTGISKPLIGPGTIDLNSINVSGTYGTLRVMITDTDFVGSFSSYAANWGGTSQGSVDFSFLYGATNEEFIGTEFASGSFAASGSNYSFADTIISSVEPSPTLSPYSLTIIADITHSSQFQITSFDAILTPVPVPAAMLLFGSAVISLFGLRRRKANKLSA